MFIFPHGYAFCRTNRDGIWPGQSSGGSSDPCRGPTSSSFTAIGQSVGLLWRPPPSPYSPGYKVCLSKRAASGGAQDAGESHQTTAKTQEEDQTQPTNCRCPSGSDCCFCFVVNCSVDDKHIFVIYLFTFTIQSKSIKNVFRWLC